MIWLNGELVEDADATVSVVDHGLTVGDGVFETMRVYDGVAFAMRRHLDRMERSAHATGLTLPPRELLAGAVRDVVAANGGGNCRARITVTGGPAPLGSGRGEGRPTVVAAVAPIEPPSPTTSVVTVP